MAADYSFNQNFDSDDEDNDPKFIYDGKDYAIFVLDVAKSMFEKVRNEESNELEAPIDICLGALEKTYREKTRRGAKDLNGIVLYNTEKSPEPKDGTDSSIVAPANCAVFSPLQKIEVDVIRHIKSTRESPDYNDFANRYGHSTNTKISDVLWLCNSLISHSGHKIHSCTVFWLTNEDSPHPINSVPYNESMQQAKDLQHLKMYFELCPMKSDFNPNMFYAPLNAYILQTDIGAIHFNYSIDVNGLKSKLLIHDNRCRALSYLTVEISDQAKFGVGVYSELSKRKEPKPINVDRKTNAVIHAHRCYKYAQLPIDNEDDNNETEYNFQHKLSADKTVKFLEIGGQKVKFTPLEVYEMKQLMAPKIKILGFKPKESFNPLHHKRSGYFIHPSDRHIKNSGKMFHTLWQTCLNMDKIILCAFSMRLKSYQQLCYLIPQVENKEFETNDGFQLVYIPYSEEIRDVSKYVVSETCTDEKVNKLTKKIMTRLKFDYNPMLFLNPVTTKIYNKLEEIEFDDEPAEFDDATIPKIEIQDARIKDYVQALSNLFEGFAEITVAKRKKEATSKDDAPAKKAALDVNYSMVYDLCQQNKTKSLNVDVLKAYLKHKNVGGLSKMKKDELIAQVVANPL